MDRTFQQRRYVHESDEAEEELIASTIHNTFRTNPIEIKFRLCHFLVPTFFG